MNAKASTNTTNVKISKSHRGQANEATIGEEKEHYARTEAEDSAEAFSDQEGSPRPRRHTNGTEKLAKSHKKESSSTRTKETTRKTQVRKSRTVDYSDEEDPVEERRQRRVSRDTEISGGEDDHRDLKKPSTVSKERRHSRGMNNIDEKDEESFRSSEELESTQGDDLEDEDEVVHSHAPVNLRPRALDKEKGILKKPSQTIKQEKLKANSTHLAVSQRAKRQPSRSPVDPKRSKSKLTASSGRYTTPSRSMSPPTKKRSSRRDPTEGTKKTLRRGQSEDQVSKKALTRKGMDEDDQSTARSVEKPSLKVNSERSRVRERRLSNYDEESELDAVSRSHSKSDHNREKTLKERGQLRPVKMTGAQPSRAKVQKGHSNYYDEDHDRYSEQEELSENIRGKETKRSQPSFQKRSPVGKDKKASSNTGRGSKEGIISSEKTSRSTKRGRLAVGNGSFSDGEIDKLVFPPIAPPKRPRPLSKCEELRLIYKR